MVLVYFDYLLHDVNTAKERIAAIAESAGIEIDDELAAKIDKPFRDVTLNCTLDTATGTVAITTAFRSPRSAREDNDRPGQQESPEFTNWASGYHWITDKLSQLNVAATGILTETEIIRLATKHITEENDLATLRRALDIMGWTQDRLAVHNLHLGRER